ncbi:MULTISPECIES: beta-lactamase regulator AmpE [unclassified Shewanella]|uniref:beta-lactamase regulator AmpE n=1 Tax=unclassified Shewanella TaxID=196818 RepID=UPI000C855D8D|nr:MULTISPECIES: beta-lactamase regulator AmpE [unclassified Shewanella]MCC4832948.1 beta-lactamase regulator AmpE [Shewanella sp. 10N.7]PMG77887.1 regulatory signaling modulator protein AmpE [Shewanella sp. 10N.286.51.B7]
MALFSLLIAIMVERLKLLPANWQFDSMLAKYQQLFWKDNKFDSPLAVSAVVLIPAIIVFLILFLIDGVFYDLVTLLLWVAIAIFCLSHQSLRSSFKKYMLAACRGDVQACYHYAEHLDCTECLDAIDEKDLGQQIGKTVAWVNYRYYGAVALFLIFFGPVGAVLYCSVRFYEQYNQQNKLDMPFISQLLFLLDWIPSRVFSFGFVLSGHFASGISEWRKQVFNANNSAKNIVTYTALAAETLPESTSAPVCVQPTLALLALSKRNFILLLTVLSVLTIFGLVS